MAQYKVNKLKLKFYFSFLVGEFMNKVKSKITRITIILFIAIICSIGLSACIPNDNPEYYSVSFIVDGTLYHSDTVKWKDSLTFPANPVKGGYDFDG